MSLCPDELNDLDYQNTDLYILLRASGGNGMKHVFLVNLVPSVLQCAVNVNMETPDLAISDPLLKTESRMTSLFPPIMCSKMRSGAIPVFLNLWLSWFRFLSCADDQSPTKVCCENPPFRKHVLTSKTSTTYLQVFFETTERHKTSIWISIWRKTPRFLLLMASTLLLWKAFANFRKVLFSRNKGYLSEYLVLTL
jgi:hypothetical protein